MTNSFLQKHEEKYRQQTTQHLHPFLRQRRQNVSKKYYRKGRK